VGLGGEVIRISEANAIPKRKKLRTKINGKYDIGNADENK
jgi:hypothetical protein